MNSDENAKCDHLLQRNSPPPRPGLDAANKNINNDINLVGSFWDNGVWCHSASPLSPKTIHQIDSNTEINWSWVKQFGAFNFDGPE